ncbi:transposase [Bdellovibrio bacteriovorus]|uniref:transposase n=1 Tax=Bdellovibrio TaxID=958 RepID=UPI0035A8B892
MGLYIDALVNMPRKKFYPTTDYPYHVTARTTNKEWFGAPMEVVWGLFSDYLHFIWRAYDVRIHAFVLMNNHFHMLISTPEANLDLAMNYLLREVSKRIGEKTGRINQIFGGPYHWSVIKNSIHYQHAYKYVYRNPVHAGICKNVEDYKYSSLPGLLGLDYLYIPVYDNLNLIQNPVTQLRWLNDEYEDEDREAIFRALKRREFGFSRDSSTARIHYLENTVV